MASLRFASSRFIISISTNLLVSEVKQGSPGVIAHLWQGDCTIGISRNLQREHLRASSLAVDSVDSVGSVDSKWLKYMSQDAQGSAVSGKLLYAQVQQFGSSSFIFF